MAAFALGIDIGGTFTDIVVVDRARGRTFTHKELTTPDDPARGVRAGLARLLAVADIAPGAIERAVHATTLFTNALIERKGARTGLITTEGFRDTLEIGRERKYDLYDLRAERPQPVVPRRLRLEVPERIKADGSVRVPLAGDDLDAAADTLLAMDVGAIAIVFLHSYLDPTHEIEAARRIAARHPQVALSTSHEVAPEVREYERCSTTVINAYIKPLAGRYLERMAGDLHEAGVVSPFHLMLSNGGLAHIDEAKRAPIQLLESGPAAGTLAAAHFGGADGEDHLLAFDMGGTTAKLSLVDHGEPEIAYSFEAARARRFIEGSGLPVRTSTVELIEIGAGGGSIARADALGLLKVGPDSAGSSPGPACYGFGGKAPTVTDADLLLGYLDPEQLTGSALAFDRGAAEAAIAELAERLGLSTTETAWGIHDVVNESMASAARVHLAERGRDPSDYALLVTGGAGPVHGDALARKLHLERVICPPSAGVASALGMLLAPARADRVQTVAMALAHGDLDTLEAAYRRLEQDAKAVVADTGLDPALARVQRFADGRFVGQGFDLVVALPDGPYDQGDPKDTRAMLAAAFEEAYRAKFAYAPPAVPIEFVNARVTVRVAVPGLPVERQSAEEIWAAPATTRPAYFAETGGFMDTPVFERGSLVPGAGGEGPAVIEEAGSTLVIGPAASWRVAASGNVVVDLAKRKGQP